MVAYFSRAGNNYVKGEIVFLPVGNTELAAKKIAELKDCTLFKIEPAEPYSGDYRACCARASKELADGTRPALAEYPAQLDEYDTVILGYPNYCGTMPMPVWTFLERYDFSGKTILPFCTHEGSGMGNSEADLKKLCPNSDIRAGLALQGCRVMELGDEIAAWLAQLD